MPAMDPYSAAFSAIGTAAAGGPSSAHQEAQSSGYLDGAGWTVSTGNAQATGGTTTSGATPQTLSGGGGGGAGFGLDLASLQPLLLLLVGAVVLKRLLK